ncbi:hypothetical protein HIM_02309 [Hirsutella minnesotensis 3608]|nr:hypothetical protein HIM_02309 [Hirsutella minnesotensis 3608]
MPSPSPSRSSTNTQSTTIPHIQVMSPPRTNTSSTSRSAKSRRQPRDTGFPEPLDEGRNTTLPHPDADLSPNATISHEDVAGDKAMLKRRRLFSLSNKHKKTINHGVISPQMEALSSVISLSVMSNDSLSKDRGKLASPSMSSLRLSKDGSDSLDSKRADDDDTPPTSPEVSEHHRKKGLLGRLRLKS